MVDVQHPAAVGQYDVLEILVNHDGAYANPWEDVRIEMTFTGPGGIVKRVGGFFYDAGQWRVRFSPSSLGSWSWSGDFTTPAGSTTISGAFAAIPSGNPGRARRSAQNPYRFIFDDGSPFYPIGFGDCTGDGNQSGSPNDDDWGLDGDFRPPGQEEGTTVSLDTYLTAYGTAGFNFYRWSVDNCAYKLWQTIEPTGNTYLVREGKWGDELAQKFRSQGFRLMLVFFGFQAAFADQTSDGLEMMAVKRYLKYCMDRYGAYVDFFELMNETMATEQWYRIVTDFVRQEDPYAHPLSTSWERTDLPYFDVNTPHWYEQENELDSDARAADMVTYAKSFGKAVVFGEQGNGVQNWDLRSGVRMRLRNWAAFFSEGSLIFWNSSFAKDYFGGGASNLYIGPEERGYVRVLRGFTDLYDGGGVIAQIPAVDHANVRQYVLASPRQVLVYLVHFTSHEQTLTERTITIPVPEDGMLGRWIDPATGATLATFRADEGMANFPVPAFTVDIALALTSVETSPPRLPIPVPRRDSPTVSVPPR